MKHIIGRLTEFLVNRLGLPLQWAVAIYATLVTLGLTAIIVGAIALAALNPLLTVKLLFIVLILVGAVGFASIIYDMIKDEITVRKSKDE